MGKREKSSYIIQSVAHALDLLEEFSGDVNELGVTELSRRLKLHKNNVFRLLATLEAKGYVEQNKITENYRLGLKALELGQRYIKQVGLIKQAKPFLEEIVDKVNETTYLGILRDGFAVYLDAVEAKRTVRVVSRVGLRLPAHCSAIGKAQVAYLSESELERIFPNKTLERFTENTITDRERLFEHLKEVREKGYAIDNEEYEKEVKCVGVPIFDYTGRVVGGISVSGPAYRMTDRRLEEEIIPVVKEVGEKISRKLGYGI